jgi:hypothetical protein
MVTPRRHETLDDMDDDKDDDMSLHVGIGTKLIRFGKFENENGFFVV